MIEQEERTLTAEEVEQIRTLARTPGVSHQTVATKFGIDVGHVKFILSREFKYSAES